MNKLEQLKQLTTVVADTGDFEAIRQYQPTDATTNPSLLLQAAAQADYAHLVADAVRYGQAEALHPDAQVALAVDKLAVNFGQKIAEVVPGYVSTEVDARLSFDTAATIAKAEHLLQLYAQLGVPAARVLIKIAATWEGIQAARELELRGIHCNLTLLFGFAQAHACAEANVTLISPFVGRILDWHKAHTGENYTAATDPGVLSVQRIYRYYKTHNVNTIVMGASFRNQGEIEQLAGCDRLTISPALLDALAQDMGILEPVLTPAQTSNEAWQNMDEASFRWHMNADAMATDKLSDGIRRFHADYEILSQQLAARL